MARHTIASSVSRLHCTLLSGRKYSWGWARKGETIVISVTMLLLEKTLDKIVGALLQGYDWPELLSEGKLRRSVIICVSCC